MRSPAHEPPRTVLLVVPSLGGGGAERVAAILARQLDRERFRPVVVLLYGGADDGYATALPPDVDVVNLQRPAHFVVPTLVLRLARFIRRTRPAAAVGFLTLANIVLILAARLARVGIPVLVTEHNDPARLRGPGRRLGLLRAARRVYPWAYRLVAVSDGVRRAWVERQGLPEDRVVRIYNPLDPRIETDLAGDVQPPHSWLGGATPTVVAAGRLERQKGFADLIRAMKLVNQHVPARLIILGEGSERERLEALAFELDLADRIVLPGFAPDVFQYMSHASVFALSSHWEGFAMVLPEAMRAGAPVVATDCRFGPGEIIEDGRTGLLVPVGDPGALASAITRVLTDAALADHLRAAGRTRSADFDAVRVIGQYERLLDAALRLRLGLP